jgi:hypothetical protein
MFRGDRKQKYFCRGDWTARISRSTRFNHHTARSYVARLRDDAPSDAAGGLEHLSACVSSPRTPRSAASPTSPRGGMRADQDAYQAWLLAPISQCPLCAPGADSCTAVWQCEEMSLPFEVAAFLTFFDHNPAQGTGPGAPAFVQHDERGAVAAKDDCGMQVASELMSLQKLWRGLFALGAISVLIAGGAHAQNIDQGKPAARLFADGCATCHRSARGLAKGRFRLTLYFFLQQHYASNSSSAWALTSYLESVDSARRGQSRAAAAKPSPPAISTSRASIRPPASIPGR